VCTNVLRGTPALGRSPEGLNLKGHVYTKVTQQTPQTKNTFCVHVGTCSVTFGVYVGPQRHSRHSPVGSNLKRHVYTNVYTKVHNKAHEKGKKTE